MIINIISEWRRGKNISQKISTNNSQFSFMIKKKTFKVQHHIYLTHLGYILKHRAGAFPDRGGCRRTGIPSASK